MTLTLPTIDLRSDTVTVPTTEMRAACARAEVGDDCYGEDRTVRELEERAADVMGMDAAVLVPSGTMGNLAAVLATTRPGDRIIVPDQSHLFLGENGGATAFGGVTFHQLPSPGGLPTVASLIDALEPYDDGVPPAALVTIENTHNVFGGIPIDVDRLDPYVDASTERGVGVHVDGSRIFNASVALGRKPAELVRGAQSVTFCLSKGLSCPVGSVLCGERDVIDRARTVRKMLGGGMRQAGIVAAAGLVALDCMIERLAEDHARAAALAAGIYELAPSAVDPASVRTNIVGLNPEPLGHTSMSLVDALAEHGILCFALDRSRVRLVTHVGINSRDIERTIAAIAAVAR